MKMETAYIRTPMGIAKVEGTSLGISSISILDEASELTEQVPHFLQGAVDQLQEYFSGCRKEFDFRIDPQGTDFQQKVWKLLLEIPFGKTISYLDLAKKFGDEKAIRAVASANGKNPLWIVIPCHRVIGSDGSLTGYAGGLWRKEWLLQHENAIPQLRLFE